MKIACVNCEFLNNGCDGGYDVVVVSECYHAKPKSNPQDNSIASSLDRIARELERMNKLKALEMQYSGEYYAQELYKIMED